MKTTASSLLAILCALLISLPVYASPPYKVLVVMSYEHDFYWSKEVKTGIEASLTKDAELTFVYMDTKVNRPGGLDKAKHAYEVYRSLKPDGVIAVDDNAQSMFVVPYLKDKVTTPVMFAGVNAEPSKYGFPNSHISGTLERGHIRESIAFIRQLMPEVKNMGFLVKESASGLAVLSQVESEAKEYSLPICSIEMVSTSEDVKDAAVSLSEKCDAVYIDGAAGINKLGGGTMSFKELLHKLKQHFKGPVIGANLHHVENGALSAVIKTGYEQGKTAGNMLLKAMQGTPMRELPITRNYRGRRVLNAEVMHDYAISPRPLLLRGVELIRGH